MSGTVRPTTSAATIERPAVLAVTEHASGTLRACRCPGRFCALGWMLGCRSHSQS